VRGVFDKKSLIIGIVMAALFLATDAVTPIYFSYETMIMVFAICLLVVCVALFDSAWDGFYCGLTALAAQSAGGFVRYATMYGTGVASSSLLYTLVLTSIYPITATLGSMIGGRLAKPIRKQ